LLEIDRRDVLAKVAAMPLSTWNYIAEGKQVRHLGPMSQDFSEAFGLGPNDKTITHLDEAGVALAAIQGLHELLLEKDKEISLLKQRMTQLEALAEDVATLKSVLSQISTINGHVTLAANR